MNAYTPAGNITKEEAIGKYWDYYRTETERLARKYPKNVMKYQMTALLGKNSTGAQQAMLSFVGCRFPKTRALWHTNMGGGGKANQTRNPN